MATSEAQKKATAKYKAKYQRRIVVDVNRKTEPEMLEWLENQPAIQTYIKQLIRKDMEQCA